MKITIVCDVLGEANNGTVIATLNLIRFLQERGHELKVVSNNFEGTGIPEKIQCKLPTLSLGTLADKIIEKNGVSLAKKDKEILLCAIKGSDVVHIQMPLAIGREASRIAHRLNIPVTASFHCQAENVSAHLKLQNNIKVSKIIYKNFWNHLYKRATCIHYPTKFIKDTFEKNIRKKTTAFVISNGVNETFVNRNESRSNEKFTIVSTGRFSTEKAQNILIKAVSLSKYRDKIRICFAGEGPLENHYKKMAKELGVDADFSFYSRTELIDLLNRGNLYVHSAFIEIEAISCIEAICCGMVPVISDAERSATRFFALDEKSLFRENDSEDLAKKIDFWYENPTAMEEYVQKYKVMSKQFDQTECMIKMELMMETAIVLNNL